MIQFLISEDGYLYFDNTSATFYIRSDAELKYIWYPMLFNPENYL